LAGLYFPNKYGGNSYREVNSDYEYKQASRDVAKAIRNHQEVPFRTLQAVLQWNGYYDERQLLANY
jgi:hypothetical protein